MADFKTVLFDKTQPLQTRLEAAKKFASEYGQCALRSTLFLIIDSEDEDPAFRSAALAMISFLNPDASIEMLVRPFEHPSVRRAAIEILDKLAPVTGEQGVLLSAELAALRGTLSDQQIEAAAIDTELKERLRDATKQLRAPNHETNRSCMVIGLPKRWGRDPRVLDFLRGELQDPDERRRHSAVFALTMVGELKAVLDAAVDPSPRVRSILANRLGYYRELQGKGALRTLLRDGNPDVSKEAKASLRLLKEIEIPPTREQPHRSSPMGQLLAEISREQLADSEIAATMPDHKIADGWLGEPGAGDAEITLAEERLGLRLPPSYRAFLTEANGFDHVGPFIYRLYRVTEINWFRVQNQDWIDAYQNPINKESGAEDITPEEHLANPEDSVRFRTAYLSSCLQISEEGDSAVVLLNPEVVDAEGEWEAWFFANWLPGAERYSSFRAYVESELHSIKHLRSNRR